MPLPDLFGRRTLERQLLETTQKVESAALANQAAATAAKALERQLLEATQKVESAALASQAAATAAAAQEVCSAGPFVRVSWFCACCLTLAIIVLTAVPAAFRDLEATVSSYCSILAGVEWPDPDVTKISPIVQNPIFIEAAYNEEYGDAHYTIWFPGRFAGKRFIIILRGSAVLSGVSDSYNLTTENRPCSSNYLYGGPDDVSCEILSGTLPGKPPDRIVEGCGRDTFSKFNYVAVEMAGFTSNKTYPDWFHTILNLPDLQTGGGTWVRNGVYNIQLPTNYLTLNQEGCHTAKLGTWDKLADVSEQPASSTSKELTFNGAEPVAIVQSNRDAEGLGNILIALAGVFLAISIGFIPVAYEEWGRWRRYRKSLKPPASEDAATAGAD